MLLVQFVHNCIDTACLIQIFYVSRTCRCQMAQIRSLGTDLISQFHVKLYACLMSDCRKMQHTVGGTSQCHIYSQSVQECLFSHNISRTDISPKHLHNLHTSFLRQLDTLGIYCRNGSITLKSHTKNLCQTVHTVGRVHT